MSEDLSKLPADDLRRRYLRATLAVEQLVQREGSFQRDQDVLLNHVARRVDSLHQLLETHLSRAKSRGQRTLNGHLAELSGRPTARKRSRRSREQAAGKEARPQA